MTSQQTAPAHVPSRHAPRDDSAARDAVHGHCYHTIFGAERPFEFPHAIIAAHPGNNEIARLQRPLALCILIVVHNLASETSLTW